MVRGTDENMENAFDHVRFTRDVTYVLFRLENIFELERVSNTIAKSEQEETNKNKNTKSLS